MSDGDKAMRSIGLDIIAMLLLGVVFERNSWPSWILIIFTIVYMADTLRITNNYLEPNFKRKPKRKPKNDESPYSREVCLFEDEPCNDAIFCKATIINGILHGCDNVRHKRKNDTIADVMGHLLSIDGDDKPKATFNFGDEFQKLKRDKEDELRAIQSGYKQSLYDLQSEYQDNMRRLQ